MADYTTSTLLKLHLGGITDTARDDLINEAISAASRRVDKICGRKFDLDANATARVFDPRSRLYIDGSLLVDDIGSASGLVVEIGNAIDGWTATTDYEVGPENALVRGLPIQYVNLLAGFNVGHRTRVRVTARWGFPAVPDEVAEATLFLAARYFKRKDSPEGVLGSSEWGTIRLSRQDPDVMDLLAAYIIHEAV